MRKLMNRLAATTLRVATAQAAGSATRPFTASLQLRLARHSARLLVGIVAGAALLVGTASAGPLAATATLQLSIVVPDPNQPYVLGTFTATGSGIVNVSGGAISVPAGLVSLASSVVSVPTTFIASLKANDIANLSGIFSVGGASNQAGLSEVCAPPVGLQACVSGRGLGGVMGLTGIVNVVVVPNVATIPLDLNTLRVGQGGSVTSPYSADAAPWTTRTAVLGTQAGTRSFTTTFVITVGSQMGNTMNMVTATRIVASGVVFPMFSRFTLTTAPLPEPSTLLLLSAGAMGLGIAARRRRR